MRRTRRLAGSVSIFSVFELLVGFMDKSFSEIIDLCVDSETSQRLDKALTQLIPEKFGLSRSRVQDLIIGGAVIGVDGKSLTDPSVKAHLGLTVKIFLPEPDELKLTSENIKLNIIYEDSDLLIINKPAGMVVHPAPGAQNGTLVNALLFHCGQSLSGIGGIKRPGIVHRIDKDTSGLLAVAKNDRTHSGLADQFFRHSVERKYLAFVYGSPSKFDGRLQRLPGLTFESDGRIKIEGRIGRSKFNRKKMTVYENFGREAITRIRVSRNFGKNDSPVASLLECQLETGRTHQIRVHLNYLGYGIIGDQIYRSSKLSKKFQFEKEKEYVKNFKRQALHAATLGFFHPRTNRWLAFSSEIPLDMEKLQCSLERLDHDF